MTYLMRGVVESEGGTAAALPIWQSFFARVIDDARKKAAEELSTGVQ